MRNNIKYIIILWIALVLIWFLSDVVVREKVKFTKDYEFSFKSLTIQQIKQFSDRAMDDYRFSEDNNVQVLSLVKILEANHYLLYANAISENRFYDIMRIVLLPSQRIQLKEKSKYVYEIKRYLRRKRNLKIEYLGYEFSDPVIIEDQNDRFMVIYLVRSNAGNREPVTYYFKKFKDRYYLYFKKGRVKMDFS